MVRPLPIRPATRNFSPRPSRRLYKEKLLPVETDAGFHQYPGDKTETSTSTPLVSGVAATERTADSRRTRATILYYTMMILYYIISYYIA